MSQFNDLLTSGCGFINKTHELNGSTFVALAAMYGRKDDNRQTYYEAQVVEAGALELIRRFTAQIQDRNSTVFVRFDIGDTHLKMLPPKAGKSQAILKCKLIRITYMKVDGEVVFHKPPKDQSTAQPALPEKATRSASAGSIAEQISAGQSVIKLDKDSPTFNTDKELLKGAGYRWDKTQFAWVLKSASSAPVPQAPAQQPAPVSGSIADLIRKNATIVKLDKDSPTFQTDKEQLKAAGYRWDKTRFAWVLKSASSASASQVSSTPANAGSIADLIRKNATIVKLDKDSPTFQTDKEQLKAAGYRWNKEKFAWVK